MEGAANIAGIEAAAGIVGALGREGASDIVGSEGAPGIAGALGSDDATLCSCALGALSAVGPSCAGRAAAIKQVAEIAIAVMMTNIHFFDFIFVSPLHARIFSSLFSG